MLCKDRLESYLRENRVPYQVQHHARAVTAQEIAASEHVPGKMLAKVVIVKAEDRIVMLALPASYRVHEARLPEVPGAQDARLAREDEFASSFPDCEVGAMPPFGNLYGVPVLVDRALAEDDTIVVQAGTHTDTLSLKYSDFARLVEPRVAEFSRRAS
jgi:Ala-tRNA(Pro) deacylase